MDDRSRTTHRYPTRARRARGGCGAEGNGSPPDDDPDCGAGKKRKIDEAKAEALASVRRMPSFLAELSPSLRDDREVALAAIEGSVYCGLRDGLEALSDNLKADRELNLLAAQKCGFILSLRLFKGDREIVMAAVSRDGREWKNISDELRGDIEVVLAAITSHPPLYSDLPEEFKRNRSIALKAVGGSYQWQLPELPDQFRGDREIVMSAIRAYEGNFFGDDRGDDELDPPHWFRSVPEDLRRDHDIMLEAVSRNGLFLRDVHLGASRDADIEIAKAALESNLLASNYVPKALKSSPELAAVIIEDQHDFHCGEQDAMLSSVRSFIGTTLLQRLEAIHNEFKRENANCNKISFRELKHVDKWSRKWKGRLWHKVYLVNKATKSASIPSDIRKTIMEFSDIIADFRLAQNLSATAPIVEALADKRLRVGDVLDAEEFYDSFSDGSQSPDESDHASSDDDLE